MSERVPFYEWRMNFPWGFLDGLAHLLHAPRFVQRPLCDRFDIALGMPDTPENFPHRYPAISVDGLEGEQ